MDYTPYLLIYDIHEYPECGGGTYFERFTCTELMLARINEISNQWKNKMEVKLAAMVNIEYKIVPVQHVTKWEISNK